MSKKIDLINGAYSQMRISGLTVQPTPEDTATALDRLETMAHEWFGRNICTGYFFEDSPDSNTSHNVDQMFWYAFETNLAIRLLADFGKEAPATLIAGARASYSFISAKTAKVEQTQYPSRMPRGSGATLRYNRWNRFFRPVERAPLSCETNLLDTGNIEDYTEHFDSYLRDGETITSAQLQVDDGLELVSSSSTDTDVIYRIKAIGNNEISNDLSLKVKIQVITSLGRVTSRVVVFSLDQFDIGEGAEETPTGFQQFAVFDGVGDYQNFITADGENFLVTE